MTATEVEHTSGWIANDSEFGARLALVRQRMGWGNVKEAAEACGIAVQSWRSWERDNVRPRDVRERAWQIAEVTGCDYRWLLDGPRAHQQPPHEPRVVKAAGRGINLRSASTAGSPSPDVAHHLAHSTIRARDAQPPTRPPRTATSTTTHPRSRPSWRTT